MKHATCYTTILGAFVIVVAAAWAVQDAQAAETWTASLTATSNDPLAKTIPLQFGVAPSATDGFDIGLDLPAPPAPPSAIKLNAYFLCSHQFVKQLKTEIRKSVDTVNWQLSVRADSDGFALNWDISNIPAALSVMMGIGEEFVDMRNLSSRSFSSGTYSLTITVGVNDPPVVSDIPNVSFPEDGSNSSIDLDNYVTDPDNTDAQIVWTYSGNIDVNVSINSVTHVVTFTSTLNWYGSETITFTATDPGSLSDSDSMTVTVSAVNDPPVVSDIPDVGFPEDGSNSSIDLDDYVTDPDNTDAEIEWIHAGNTNVNVFINSVTHVVTFTSTLNWHGSETINFIATDPGSLSDSDSMTVTVSAVNDPPLVSNIPDVSFVENGVDSSIDLDDYVTDPDNTDAEITWICVGNTNVNVFIDPITHVVVFTATLNWHGSETVTFTASDPVGLSDNDSVTISVFTASDTDVSLIVQTFCPVDLLVTDPGDRAISKGSSAIPSAIYIEMDLDGDGDPDDRVFISGPLVGDYSIEVIPEPGADPLDTYTLDVSYGNELLRLAEDVRIHDIPAQPYSFFFPCCKMKAGWNLISLPLRPPNPYPGDVLATIHGRYNSVWAYDPDTGWSVYTPEAVGDLEEMGPEQGYWIKMDRTGVLILQGTDPEETDISLEGGKWNLVGYSSRKARSPEDCMSSVANTIESVWEYNPGMGWYIYSPGGYSDLQLMKPARGYWIKAYQGCIWIY